DSYILPFTRYHSRYTQITEDDFQYDEYLESFKGFEPKWGSTGTTEFVEPNIENVTEETAISEKAERYYRKYIELCMEENIPLLLTCAPYMIEEDAQGIYNYMFSIAEEYGVPYLDFNKLYDELGLVFTEDMCEWSHLNEKGNVKYTTYLGNYIKENYEIPDRRGDENYVTWQQDADRWTQELNLYNLPGIKDAEEFISLLDNPYYTVIVTINEGNDFSVMSNEVETALAAIGISQETLAQKTAVVKDEQVLFQSSEEEYEWYTSLKKGDIIVNGILEENEENITAANRIYINGTEYSTTGSPLVITVYDNLLNTRIGTIGLIPEDGYSTIQ
ncbi:MAG TPA: hypothetical protein PLU43_08335, partial [Lachnospiraceae bacterium]|nr:hypothetical protein [Lachnospiraceae bacterium]